MGQRICLFFAGYSAIAPSLYFNHLSFINQYSESDDPVLKALSVRFSEQAANWCDEQKSNLRTANSLATHFEIDVKEEPENPVAYFEWLQHYVEGFEQHFPMSRMDHYYFLYARKLADVFCNLGQAHAYLNSDFIINEHPFLLKKVDSCLKDSEYIFFKLIAAAALLSSEHRQNYFNTLYKQLNTGFDKFRNLNLAGIGQVGQQQLCQDISEYRTELKTGIKQCVGLLKELGV